MLRNLSCFPIQLDRLAVCLLSLLVASNCLGQKSVAELVAEIESVQQESDEELGRYSLTELMARANVPGISIAVIKDFEVHWAKGYGIADIETGKPVDSETLFQAASISKPVNAMALLKTAEEGAFSIDDDINSILKSWQLPNNEFTQDRFVTPRMLASHISGLGDGFGFPGYSPNDPLPNTVEILDGSPLSNVGPVRMARPPMQAFHYSGGGVTILQLLLTDTHEKPYAQIMQELVLDPVGMSNSTFQQPLPPQLDQNAARGHLAQGQSGGDKWHVYPEQAAAGLWTTPTDLAKFAIEVQKSLTGNANNVLTVASTKEMVSPVGVGNYAVGFSLNKRGEGWYFNHGGGNWGFISTLYAHKVKGYGYAIMTNSFGGGRLINELRRRIETAYEFDTLAEPVRR